MKNILVGVDFHDTEGVLVDAAATLAGPFGAKVWLLHVAAPDPDFVGYEVGPQYIRDSRAKELRKEHRLLLDYVERLRRDGVEADGLLIQGATTDMILAEAGKLHIDLIVAGHSDRSALYKAFFGSTSSKLIRKSPTPVLVVPYD